MRQTAQGEKAVIWLRHLAEKENGQEIASETESTKPQVRRRCHDLYIYIQALCCLIKILPWHCNL